jgi:hypothetical protein
MERLAGVWNDPEFNNNSGTGRRFFSVHGDVWYNQCCHQHYCENLISRKLFRRSTQFWEKRLLPLSCLSVSLSVHLSIWNYWAPI